MAWNDVWTFAMVACDVPIAKLGLLSFSLARLASLAIF